MPKRESLVVGFRDEAALVKSFAKRLSADAAFASATTYPAGEWRVVGPAKPPSRVTLVSNIGEAPSSLFRILLLAEALQSAGAKRLELIAPWIAYGRQDRVTVSGEASAGLVVAGLLAGRFARIVTLDAHSPAFVRAFKGKLSNVLPLTNSVKSGAYDLAAAPDAGAKTRALRFARALRVPLVLVEKKRREGRVTSQLLSSAASIKGKRVLLIDDIADSGSTLVAAAVELKKAGARSVSAFVTHAVDLSALKKSTRGRLDSIEALFDHATDQLAPTAVNALKIF